jgi:hypothetical protein
MHDTLTRSRLQTGAHHLHAFGPHAVVAFIEELAKRIRDLPAAVRLLAKYSSVSPVPRPRCVNIGPGNDCRRPR